MPAGKNYQDQRQNQVPGLAITTCHSASRYSEAAVVCGFVGAVIDPFPAGLSKFQMDAPDFVGQELNIEGATPNTTSVVANGNGGRGGAHSNSLVYGQTYVFVLADEINPLQPKAVRRVLVNPKMAAEASRNLGRPLSIFPNPERFGFHPTDPASPLSLGRHAMGMKPSSFQSASTRMFGATRFTGTPFWIDVEAAGKAGATFHTTKEIIADLDRIAAKTRGPGKIEQINRIKQLVQADAEKCWCAAMSRLPQSRG